MATAQQLVLGPIGQIAVNVQDVARATAFYRDTLGIRHLFDAPPGLSFFDAQGIRLMLSVPESNAAGSSVLYFRVGDIQDAYRSLSERGVSFEGEPHLIAKMPDHELWMAFFRDSEDNMLALMSEVRS